MVVLVVLLPAVCGHGSEAGSAGVGSVVSWYSDVCGSVHVHEGLSLSRGVVHRMVVKVKALMPDDEMMSVRRGMTTVETTMISPCADTLRENDRTARM
jgi:hypothetical protein